MALVGDIHLDLAGRGSAKALFRAALGLQLGHFRFLSLWTARHALWALIARPAIRWSGGLYRRDSAKATLYPRGRAVTECLAAREDRARWVAHHAKPRKPRHQAEAQHIAELSVPARPVHRPHGRALRGIDPLGGGQFGMPLDKMTQRHRYVVENARLVVGQPAGRRDRLIDGCRRHPDKVAELGQRQSEAVILTAHALV